MFATSPRIVGFGKKTDISEIKNDSGVQFDPENKIVRCELKPKQALWIGSDMNFSLENDYAAAALKERLVYLNIETDGKTVKLTPDNVLEHFKTYRKYVVVGFEVK